jgi:hypothetical protein
MSVAFVIRQAKRMRTVKPVACPPLAYFSTLSHKDTIFGEEVIEHKMCVLISSTTFVRNVSHSKKKSEIYE